MSQSTPPPLFLPLDHASRTSARVADAIRRVIVGGQLQPGETLPPERALAQRFSVTRNTVREALRTLEQLRLVTIRQGSGIRVRDYLTHAGLELVVELLDSSDGTDTALMAELAEARQIIGKAMNHYAIDHFTPADLPDIALAIQELLTEANKPEPDLRQLQELDFEVHNRLVKASGNRALLLMHNSIRYIYRQVAPLFTPLVSDPEPLISFHRQLLSALERGDRPRAKALCTRYFELGRQALARDK